MKRPN